MVYKIRHYGATVTHLQTPSRIEESKYWFIVQVLSGNMDNYACNKYQQNVLI